VKASLTARLVFVLCAVLAFGSAQALYDDKPAAALSVAEGAWQGTLTYRDYSHPDRTETLPTRLFVALGAPGTLVLHYVYDDGPGKTVHSYESMAFDFAKGEVTWISGSDKKEQFTARVVSIARLADVQRLIFERTTESGKDRYTLDLASGAFALQHEELDGSGASMLRNRHEFKRAGT
jgi:hypothetical protein